LGEIEYIRKHSNQLVCASSEDAARGAVWAGSHARVNTLKRLTHIGHAEGEQSSGVAPVVGTVLFSKKAKKEFSLPGSMTSVSWLVFPL
jgi:hypothetical protein